MELEGTYSPLCDRHDAQLEKHMQNRTADIKVEIPTAADYAQLEQQAQQAALINHIVKQMRSTLVLDEVLQITVEELHAAVNVSHCVIFRANSKYIKTSCISEAAGASLIGASSDLYNYYHQTLVAGESVVIPRIGTSLPPEIPNSSTDCGVGSILIVPLLYQEKYLGGISLHQCDREREWTTDELKLVKDIAEHCAVAIHQCELYQQAQTELAQSQRTEDILLDNSCDLLEILQAFPDLYFRLDSDGTILSYYAGQMSQVYFPPNVYLKKKIQHVMPDEVGRQLQEGFQQVLHTKSIVTIEYSLTLPEGEKFFEARVLPSPGNQLLVIIRDVTIAKQADLMLRESEEHFRKLCEATFEGIVIHVNGKVIDANQSLSEMTGYAISELIGMDVLELLAVETRDLVLEHILSEYQSPYESIALRKDGRIFPVEIQAKYMLYNRCRVRVAAVRDITQRKQAEELLKNQKEFLRQVIDTTPHLIFAKEWKGKFTLVNQALADIYGTTVENLLGKSDADFNFNQEEVAQFLRADREVMKTGIEKIITEETVTDFTGKVHWFQTIKKPLISPDGKKRQVLGIATDITKRKQAELALQQAKEELEIKVEERTTELKNANEQLQKEVTEREAAETLLAGQNCVLEMIATGAALSDVLDVLAWFVEKQSQTEWCAISLLDDNGIDLCYGAAPNLPAGYKQATDNIAIGPNVGCCGTAAYLQEPVIVSDIATDPKWEAFRDLALSHGLRACYSTPIFASNGNVLGTFALYYSTPRSPSLNERKLIALCSHIAGIAIEYKRAEQALKDSKERFRNLVETTSDLVWEVDENNVYTYVSPHISDLLGYAPEEVLGKTPFDFMHLEEHSRIANIFSFIVASKQPFSSLENINLHKDGHEVFLETSGVPFFDADENLLGYSGIARDISERKLAEQAIQESEEKFRNLVEQTNDWVWEFDKNGVFTYVNPKLVDILGYHPSEMLGKSIFLFMSLDEAKRFTPIFENFISQQEAFVNVEKNLIHKKGCLVVLESSGTPMFAPQGVFQGYRGIARDITERKQVELEIRNALEKEKELSELKSRFVTMTSHEFRTPLSTILSSAELLEHYSHKFTEEKKLAHLHRIQAGVQRMIALLNDVLVIGKAEAGRLELNPAPIDLIKFGQNLASDMQESAGFQYTITFVSQGKCYPNRMDEKVLQHIFSNLLSNAIKYSPKGGKIDLKLVCQDGLAIFQVQDRGIGIPPSDQKHLFDTFHRATNVGTIPGTGLGLAIVKKCVELHGGRIVVQSEVGCGTTVKVTLPLNYQTSTKKHEENFSD